MVLWVKNLMSSCSTSCAKIQICRFSLSLLCSHKGGKPCVTTLKTAAKETSFRYTDTKTPMNTQTTIWSSCIGLRLSFCNLSWNNSMCINQVICLFCPVSWFWLPISHTHLFLSSLLCNLLPRLNSSPIS